MLWDRTCADFHYQPKTPSSPSTPVPWSPGPRDAACVMSPAYFMHVDRVFGWLRLQTETQSELPVNNSEMSPTGWGTMSCIRDEQQVCVWHERSQRERKSSGAANESMLTGLTRCSKELVEMTQDVGSLMPERSGMLVPVQVFWVILHTENGVFNNLLMRVRKHTGASAASQQWCWRLPKLHPNSGFIPKVPLKSQVALMG